MKYFRRELKVCEGCGGLWVRTGAEAGVYCRTCSALVADLPGRRRRSPGRPCKVHGVGSTRLQVVTAAAVGEQPQLPRGRCVRGTSEQRAEEQRMQAAAVERRAGMALVALPVPAGPEIAGAAVHDEIREVAAAECAAVVAMPKPAGRAVQAETFVAVAMVGGAR